MEDKNKTKDAAGSLNGDMSVRSEAELRYGALFEQSPDGILIIDAEGKILDFNKAAHTDLGYTREEFAKLKISDIDPLESPEEIRAHIQKTIGQIKAQFEVTHRTKSGQLRNVLVITQAIVLSGQPVLHTIWRDITDQKASDKKVRYLASILEHVPDAVCSMDTEGRIVSWNEGAERMLGFKADEVIGRPVKCIIPEEKASEEIQHCIGELNKKGAFTGHDTVRVAKDGLRLPVEISGLALRDGQNITGYASIMRVITERLRIEKARLQDITERKRMEEDLQSANQILKAITRYSPLAIITTDLDGNILTWNPAAEQIFGWSEEEVLGRKNPIVPADKKEEYNGLQEKVRKGVPYYSRELLRQKKDGVPIYLNASSASMHSDDGKVIGLLGIFEDITERKKAEEALRTREKQLAESQRIAHIGSWEHNLKTGQVFWSDELFRLLGLDPKTDPGDFKMFFDMLHPEDREALKRAIDETVKTGKHFSIDYRLNRRDGNTPILHAQAELLPDASGDPVVLSGTAQDITEWKKSESALKESERRLRTLIDAIPDAVFFKDAAGRHIIANKANEDLFALSPAMFLGKMVEDLLPPDLAAICRRNDEDVLKNKKTVRDEEQSTDKNGNKQILDTIRVPLHDDNGNAIGLVVIIRDITERKLAEEVLINKEQFIRNILDTVDEGFIVIDRDFLILTANKAYCCQAGESCDSVIGHRCYEISHKALRPCYEEGEECAVRHVFETGEPHTALHKHPDSKGSILYVETKAFPIKDSKGAVTSVIETVNNITERHLLEEEQLKTQKLEAIGTLAGGIAHDFNNLLQGVFGYISMAKMTLDQKERSLAMLEQAEKALHMSVDLTTQLLTFSKGGKPLKRKIQLQSVIENSAKFALSGSSVDYRIKFEERLWSVEADEGQIGQVIQNIVLNADQAMPGGGTIVIAARNVSAPGKGLPARLAEGNYVEISVKDNGIGVPEKYIPRLFDPYFTTKEKGSGLGLATSYSIIKNHGGLLDVQSRLGKGSTFVVYLPALGAVEGRSAVIPSAADSARKGRVLVMDDEELVRNIVGIMLGALGHEVKFAENGEEAIEKYHEALSAGRKFDIVVLDLTVRGGMGGEETLRELLALDPGVKAVVSSGYANSAAVSEYRARGFSACLAKPYEVDALRDVLNMLLR